jgi:hypothetical protein
MPRRLFWLSNQIRALGIHLMAGKGSGKSRLMGRVIAWLDFLQGIPLVILDPVGPTIDNFLDKMLYLPQEYQERLWKRVIYVDMSGTGDRAVGWPLYYRLGDENLYAISQRYLDVVRRVDPALQSASVEGFNALWKIGTYTGIVLAALGLQITEAEQLLRNPQAWVSRITQAVQTYPELQEAATFFTEQYIRWKEDKQASRTDAFRTKIALLTIDPAMRAMFGADTPGIDWAQVVEKRQAVLLDFRHVHDLERRRFLILWVYMSLMEFIKHRGAGRHTPISLIVDELAALGNFRTSSGSSLFADDLEELINVYARNHSVWLTLAHQELYQFEERIQKTLMTMGTHIFGVTSDPEAALTIARHIFFYDPKWLKRRDPLYMSDSMGPYIVDERPVEFSAEEQAILHSARFRQLRTFHFLVRPAPGEGTVTGELTAVSIENFDRGLWVNEELVARARALLRERCSTPIPQLLAAIETRLQVNPTKVIGTINSYDDSHYLPIPEEDDDEATLREEKAPTSEASNRRRGVGISTHQTRR